MINIDIIHSFISFNTSFLETGRSYFYFDTVGLHTFNLINVIFRLVGLHIDVVKNAYNIESKAPCASSWLNEAI